MTLQHEPGTLSSYKFGSFGAAKLAYGTFSSARFSQAIAAGLTNGTTPSGNLSTYIVWSAPYPDATYGVLIIHREKGTTAINNARYALLSKSPGSVQVVLQNKRLSSIILRDPVVVGLSG